MSRRPTRLIRLAQHLAVALGLDTDQDADAMTEEDLRELLNAALDYVEAEEARLVYSKNNAPTYTMPNRIGGAGQYTWTNGIGGSGYGALTYNNNDVLTHAHGTTTNKQFISSVNEH